MIAIRTRIRLWFRRCSTCGQRMTSPPCCKTRDGRSGHTVSGGVGQAAR